jgi:hypothetical protein
MPVQKDLKRLVRARMEKTGESYTTARLHLVRKQEPAQNYGTLAGMSDAAVRAKTGRSWAEWVRLLDAAGATSKTHRDIAKHVSSLGTPSWWTQTVTVGYERIRGLRERGQQRSGEYRTNKARTFGVSIDTLFEAFADTRKRRKWLPIDAEVKSATAPKRMRIICGDGTVVLAGFTPKGAAKSAVAIEHDKLPSKSAAEATKKAWGEHFDRLGEYLA